MREDPFLFEVDGEFFVKGDGCFPVEDPEMTSYPLQRARLCLMSGFSWLSTVPGTINTAQGLVEGINENSMRDTIKYSVTLQGT